MTSRQAGAPKLVIESSARRVIGRGHAEYVRVDDLVVDDNYQRIVNERHVARIAESFDADLLGTIDVANRNGTYYVVDGQHRILALRQRGMGDSEVLCNVWLSDGGRFEAHVFDGKNNGRKNLAAFARYKARVHAEKDTEKAVAAMLGALEIEVVPSQSARHGWNEVGVLYAIGTVTDLYKMAPKLTERTMQLLRDAWSDKHQAYDANIIKGTAAFLAEHGGEIERGEMVDQMRREFKPADVIDQAWAKKGSRQWPLSTFVAEALLEIYNAHRRNKVQGSLPKVYGYAVKSYMRRVPEDER